MDRLRDVLNTPKSGFNFLLEVRRDGAIVSRSGREQSTDISAERLISDLCTECALAKEIITYIRVKDSSGKEYVRHYPAGTGRGSSLPSGTERAKPPLAALPSPSTAAPKDSQSGDSLRVLPFVRKVVLNTTPPKGAVVNLFKDATE